MREEDLVISDNPYLDREIPSVVSNGSPEEGSGLPVREEDIEQLERGSLVELDVELESAEVYEYYRVIQAFDDIFQTISSESELREELRAQELSSEEISMVIELMEILMADLVPIVGTVQNYGVAENSEVVVEKGWAEENGVDFEELKIAGFVDEDNLWLDPTRVLFDRNEFTVYSRVDSPRIQDEWMPMKLLDIVETVFPGVAEDIQNLPDAFDETKPSEEGALNVLEGQTPIGSSVEEDVIEYLDMLDDEFGLDVDEDVKEGVVEAVLDGSNGVGVDERMGVLREVEAELAERDFEFSVDDAGRADLVSALWSREDVELGSSSLNDETENHLEMDFVAIYW